MKCCEYGQDSKKLGRSCGLRVESRMEFHSGKLKHSNLLIAGVKSFIVDTCGLYYKQFTIVSYDRNAIGQYYKTTSTTIVDYDRR